jgi:hypothetical protein
VQLVLAGGGEALVATFAQAVEVAAEIPAARALAQIAAERPLVAQLRAAYGGGGLRQHRIAIQDLAVGGDLGQSGQGSDPQATAWARADALEIFDGIDTHQAVGLEHSIAETSQQVRTTGEDARLRLGRGCRRLFNR